MQDIRWYTETSSVPWPAANPPADGELWRLARGEIPLAEAFRTLTRCDEEQKSLAADLHERETWALTLLLARSAPIWDHSNSPTLCFELRSLPEQEPCHLELGRFSHLAALIAPSAFEQALIATQAPCWARVYPHQERQSAGQTGPLACSYAPISTAEAVATLDFAIILTQIEAAAQAAGAVLLSTAQTLRERDARVQQVERMLGWTPDPSDQPPGAAAPIHARLVLLIVAHSRRIAWSAVFVGCVAVLLSFLLGML